MTFKRLRSLIDTAKRLYEDYKKLNTGKGRQYDELTFLVNLLIEEVRKRDGSYDLDDVKSILKKLPADDSLFPYHDRDSFIKECFNRYHRMGRFNSLELFSLKRHIMDRRTFRELTGLYPKGYKKDSMGYFSHSVASFIYRQPGQRINQYLILKHFSHNNKKDLDRIKEYLKFKYNIHTHREGYKKKSIIYSFAGKKKSACQDS